VGSFRLDRVCTKHVVYVKFDCAFKMCLIFIVMFRTWKSLTPKDITAVKSLISFRKLNTFVLDMCKLVLPWHQASVVSLSWISCSGSVQHLGHKNVFSINRYHQLPGQRGNQHSQRSVIGWLTKIYFLDLLHASEGMLSRRSRLHLQSLAPALVSKRVDVRQVVGHKNNCQILSQIGVKHVPTPLSGIRVGRRYKQIKIQSIQHIVNILKFHTEVTNNDLIFPKGNPYWFCLK
jgi:hypothetical protein